MIVTALLTGVRDLILAALGLRARQRLALSEVKVGKMPAKSQKPPACGLMPRPLTFTLKQGNLPS